MSGARDEFPDNPHPVGGSPVVSSSPPANGPELPEFFRKLIARRLWIRTHADRFASAA